MKQHGFTLVEILVAIIVLAFGLLGLAGLQLNSLKNNNSAYLRTQATLLAYDMLDRMRANQPGVANGDYDQLLETVPTDPGCIETGCSVSDIAETDAWEWTQIIGEVMPSGKGRVVGNGEGSIFTITVMWDDNHTGANGMGCSGDTKVDLTCFTLSSTL